MVTKFDDIFIRLDTAFYGRTDGRN